MKQGAEQSPQPPEPKPQCQRRIPGFWLLWLIATLLILGSEPRWLADSCRILDSPVRAVLAPESAWSPPLIRLSLSRSFADWPYWVFAMAGGALIAGACRRLLGFSPLWLAATVLVGLSLMMAPRDLIPAALMLGAARMVASLAQPIRWQRAAVVWVAFAVAGLMLTLEFGLVLMFVTLLLEGRMWDQPRLRWRFAGGLLGLAAIVTALAAVVFPGLPAAAARPISWIWMSPAANVLPSLRPVFYDVSQWLPQGLLAAFVSVCWFRNCVAAKSAHWELLALLLWALIGISCGRYFWICMFASATTVVPRAWPDSLGRVNPLVIVGCLALAIALHFAIYPYYVDYLINGALLANRVDPTRWDTRGPVLLLDLDQSPDWQTPALEHRFPLLIDDRWDGCGDFYSIYAAARRDLEEDRGDRYLLSDGTWGGYRHWIDDWSPALLVTPTGRIDDIRRLAMSPHWKFMGMDARRVIFGRSEHSPNGAQSRRALATLTSLEWPGEHFSGVDSRVIVVSSLTDAVPVANALCAMRFPYAALRVLPVGSSPTTEDVRTWCYLELAHRARDHTGRVSLLDQYRAVAGVHRVQSESRLSAAELLKMAGSLEGLALPDLAAATAQAVLDGRASGEILESDFELARAILRETEISRAGLNDGEAAPQEAESTIRAALERGDADACDRTLSRLDGVVREFYVVLCSAPNQSPAELRVELGAAIDRADFPGRLREEALFYLACLAIEAGEAEIALTALSAANTGSVYQPLQRLYQQQLRQH